MKTILILILHIFLSLFSGHATLITIGKTEITRAHLLQAFLVGILFEVGISFIFMLLGIKIYYSLILLILGSLISIIFHYIIKKRTLSYGFKLKGLSLNWYDYLLGLLVLQKILAAIYFLFKVPLYFDDAMTHWSGKGRALFGEVNWSTSKDDLHFLGQQFGFEEYPLLSPIWRANTASLNGSWNEIIAKADSTIFFIVLILGLYELLSHLGTKRWIKLGAILILVTLPLQIFHAIAGYSEISLQALSVVALLSILRKEWIVSGCIVGLMVFAKNEGLLLYLPIFSLVCLYHIKTSKPTSFVKEAIKYTAALFLSVAPWIIFKIVNAVPFRPPLKIQNYYHEGSIAQFGQFIFDHQSSHIFWIAFIIISIIGLIKTRTKDLGVFLTMIALFFIAFVYIFCFTGANIFLTNQMTVHRSLLQIAPLAIFCMVYIVNNINHKKEILN